MRISDWSSDVCSSDLSPYSRARVPWRRCMPARDIDHLVVMTSDLESARAGWEQLGFTTTPRAVHPFGTANSLIQLQGNFIELVEVDDAARIPPMAGSFFSFAAHNQAFLDAMGEGASMLVLTSDDRAADRSDERREGKEGVSTCRS